MSESTTTPSTTANLHSPLLSRKSRRQVKKATNRRNPVLDSVNDSNGTPICGPEDAEPASETYDCCICFDVFPFEEGVVGCSDHYICNECATTLFCRSLQSRDEFPASCCAGTSLPLKEFEHLLAEETIQKYQARLEEHHTPPENRLYCCNPECGAFLPPRRFIKLGDERNTTFAICKNPACEKKTCILCKKETNLSDHRCDQGEDCDAPDWLPEYTQDFRVKKCPKCRVWVELSEACNHMECIRCSHQFCFVCLLPWKTFHVDVGCPAYSDPPEGYDDEGFERTQRALHRLSGRDRDGYDRKGYDSNGYDRTGFDKYGYDRDGYDIHGYDKKGVDRSGERDYRRLESSDDTSQFADNLSIFTDDPDGLHGDNLWQNMQTIIWMGRNGNRLDDDIWFRNIETYFRMTGQLRDDYPLRVELNLEDFLFDDVFEENRMEFEDGFVEENQQPQRDAPEENNGHPPCQVMLEYNNNVRLLVQDEAEEDDSAEDHVGENDEQPVRPDLTEDNNIPMQDDTAQRQDHDLPTDQEPDQDEEIPNSEEVFGLPFHKNPYTPLPLICE